LGTIILTVADDRVADIWVTADEVDTLRQLGRI
jgi:predicted ester cyclase